MSETRQAVAGPDLASLALAAADLLSQVGRALSMTPAGMPKDLRPVM